MMNWLFRHKMHHVLFWGIYFIFWTAYGIYFFNSPLLWSLLVTSIWFVGHAGSAYTAMYVLIPGFFNKKRYGWFTLFFLLLWMAGALLTVVFMLPVLRHLAGAGAPPFGALFGYALVANFYTLFLFIAVKMIREKILGERRARLLEKERTENELRFLKSQINPHFLFNAINSIYVLIMKD
ncbi:MAG TPA: histidine kinase, partial [Chitinophaga sp.]